MDNNIEELLNLIKEEKRPLSYDEFVYLTDSTLMAQQDYFKLRKKETLILCKQLEDALGKAVHLYKQFTEKNKSVKQWLIERIEDKVLQNGEYLKSTCLNWNAAEHNTHLAVANILRNNGYTVTREINYGVTDWVITK